MAAASVRQPYFRVPHVDRARRIQPRLWYDSMAAAAAGLISLVEPICLDLACSIRYCQSHSYGDLYDPHGDP